MSLTATRDAAESPRDPKAGSQSSRYIPGLDGMRGLCLFAILAYHDTGGAWFKGALYGLSFFFTLSGFLITSLLLRTLDGGRIGFSRFWSNRARRVLPAAWAAVVLTAALQALRVLPVPLASRNGLLWASSYLANWHWIRTSMVPQLNQGQTLLVGHFWSLAFEEQFYVAFPIVMFVAHRFLRGRAWVAWAVLGAASYWYCWTKMTTDFTFAYLASTTRVGEVLVGAVLAYAVRTDRFARLQHRLAKGRYLDVVGLLALACLVVMSFTIDSGIVDKSALVGHPSASAILALRFCLLANILTAVIIVACLQPSVMNRLVSWRPLPWIGRITYGGYVYQFVIFASLTPDRLHIHSRAAVFALHLACLLPLAWASQRFLEGPILRRREVSARSTALRFCAAGAAVFAFLWLVPLPIGHGTIWNTPGTGGFERTNARATGASLRVEITGGASAISLYPALREQIADPAGGHIWMSGRARAGCPASTALLARLAYNPIGPVGIECRTAIAYLASGLQTDRADVLVAVAPAEDVQDQPRTPPASPPRTPTTGPAAQALSTDEDVWRAAFTDWLDRQDVPTRRRTVVVLVPEPPSTATSPQDEALRDRVRRMNAVVRSVAEHRSRTVVLDPTQVLGGPGNLSALQVTPQLAFTPDGASAITRALAPLLDAPPLSPTTTAPR